jgi:hypothetical protein
VEWAHGHVTLGTSAADSMGSGNIVRVYDLFDSTGTTYFLGLRPNAGNTSNYRISVHLNGNGTYQGANNESATSGNVTPGQPAFASVNTGSSPTGFDALVVQNNNGGSGSYTLYRDTAAPSGTISVNSGAAFTNSTSVTLGLAATNPTSGDPVSDMRFSNDGTTFGAWVPFAAGASYALPSGDGAKTVFVQYRNGAGAISATASDSITLDTTKPTIPMSPAPSFQKVHVGTTAVPILITWSGADAGSGVSHYDFEESIDGGAFTLLSHPTGTSATVSLNPGHAYKFEVRATDNAGNVGFFRAGSQFTLTAVQETASSITYTTGWTHQAVTGAYGGSVQFATAAARKATLSFTGKQVAWVSTIASNRGSATVSLDGGAATTVNTHGTATKPAMVVYTATKALGSHTLVVNVLGTAGHARVDVDAFLVIK